MNLWVIVNFKDFSVQSFWKGLRDDCLREPSGITDRKAPSPTSQQGIQHRKHIDRLLFAFPLVCRGRHGYICNAFLQPLYLQGHGWRVVWALYNKKEISWLGLTLHLSWATGLQPCHLLSQVRWNWILLIRPSLSNYLFIYNVYIFQNDLIWDATAWSIMDY